MTGKVLATQIALRDQENPARETQSIITQEAAADGGYSTILIDPPWHYKATLPRFAKKPDDRSEVPYMYLSDQEIADLPILGLAGAAAHLYLWTTNTHLPVAFEIVKAWGFTYSTMLVWRKASRGRAGFPVFPIRCEYILFCRLGSLKADELADDSVFEFSDSQASVIDQFLDDTETWAELARAEMMGYNDPWAVLDHMIDARRQKHSAKPPEFREMFGNISPRSRIEIFAREYAMDWRSMGVELSGMDIRDEIARELADLSG